MKYLLLGLFLLSLQSCSDDDNTPNEIVASDNSFEIVNELSYNDFILNIGQEKLSLAVEEPNSDGALGRNKDGYFHVRFQINMTSVSDFAIVTERTDALQYLANTIKYSFQRQLSDGSFEFSPPEDLVNSPDYSPPVVGDLESGTAFFASSLGISLLSLQSSDWFLTSQETQEARNEIVSLNPSFELTLDYLINQKEILKQYDAAAPNRLLFDALAYYSLGTYLSRTDAQNIAFEFIDLALDLVDAEQGYFIEGGGWDSSYNGVAIKLAMELYALIENTNQRDKIGKAMIPATLWQISRINDTGEVSTEGNTRVYDGGESFLGEEKGVDYVKIVRALYYFGYLTDSADVVDLGDQVLSFYN